MLQLFTCFDTHFGNRNPSSAVDSTECVTYTSPLVRLFTLLQVFSVGV